MKKEDGKTGQTDSGDQEKQPVQESGGAANDFKVEKKTKKKSENSTDKKKTEKGNDSRTEQNEENLRWRKSLMKDTLLPARPIMTF